MMTAVARRSYTDAEKAEALALYEEHGPREASRRCGIDAGTITRWAKAAGLATLRSENATAAVEARQLSMEQRKLVLAAGLMDDIARLRDQLFAPCVERKALTVGVGKGFTEVAVVDVHLDRPAFVDQRAIMTSVAIAVDKVQILTGDVTSRTETIGREPEQVKERLAVLVDLQARRVA